MKRLSAGSRRERARLYAIFYVERSNSLDWQEMRNSYFVWHDAQAKSMQVLDPYVV